MAEVNANNRWVRVLRTTANGFVEFEFFVSDKDLYVELILPEAAFREFCAINRVRLLEGDAGAVASAGGLLQRIK
ncbi:MAG: phenol hydroxylase subunit [Telluria sp.]|nr:phenol hydroxylase subunit [Telluria sp.]